MKCSELIEVLKGLAPEDCACERDNPGLLAGRSDKEIRKVHIALDATDRVVEAAIEAGAHTLLAHHPLISKVIKQANDQNFITRRLVKLIQSGTSYYAMYTNFDATPGRMTDLAARGLGLEECVPLEFLGEMDADQGPVPYGIGKAGIPRKAMTVRRVAKRVKEAFDLPFALVYGQELMDMEVIRISLCPGAGGSEIEGTVSCGPQMLMTGDISHHQGTGAAARQMVVIDAGHYGLEHTFIPYTAEYLEARLGGELKIIQAPPAWLAVTV